MSRSSTTEDTVGIDVALLEAIVIPTEDGGSLWDPLPVTLPTYVTKPKAKRTVRTIDLGEPGTWTSGRTDEDTQIVAQAAAENAEAKAADGAANEGDAPARRRLLTGFGSRFDGWYLFVSRRSVGAPGLWRSW